MSNLSDDSDRPSTLPQPELNPLLNPVLSKNMGRWAEVYFTSLPEKRDEAVAQLIRELEGENPSSEDAPKLSPKMTREPARVSIPTATDQTLGSTCFWCGYVNRREYKFCGRCGEPLAAPFADLRTDRNGHGNEREEAQRRGHERGEHERDEFAFGDPAPRILPSLDALPHRSSKSGFLRSETEEDVPILAVEPDRPSFRPWIAAVLATVVVAVAFIAWHSPSSKDQLAVGQAAQDQSSKDQSARTDSPAPSPVATSNEPAETPDTKPHDDASMQLPAGAASKNAPVAPIATPSVAGPNESALYAQSSGKGAEELIQAQDFLDGRNGKPRNTPLAAQWLWKAVRKENIEATVLLSGLYLRGEGVEKNCDQARLLLDAAALKGRKDAALQLKDMSAFGCQ